MGRNAASGQIPEHVHPVDLRAAHRNHRHQSCAPNSHQAMRVTSETGRGVTSLSGVYTGVCAWSWLHPSRIRSLRKTRYGSLVPRTSLTQGALAGACFAAGYGLGVSWRWLWAYLELPELAE